MRDKILELAEQIPKNGAKLLDTTPAGEKILSAWTKCILRDPDMPVKSITEIGVNSIIQDSGRITWKAEISGTRNDNLIPSNRLPWGLAGIVEKSYDPKTNTTHATMQTNVQPRSMPVFAMLGLEQYPQDEIDRYVESELRMLRNRLNFSK